MEASFAAVERAGENLPEPARSMMINAAVLTDLDGTAAAITEAAKLHLAHKHIKRFLGEGKEKQAKVASDNTSKYITYKS